MNRFLETALTQFGIKEIPGGQDNPEILKYFDILGFDGSKLKDETAWCSAVHNWIAIKSGAEHTGKLNATSWLEVGRDLHEPVQGCTVVFWRGQRKGEFIPGTQIMKGHVGTFINRIGENIYCLGGNQRNEFNIIPYHESRVLGYRSIM